MGYVSLALLNISQASVASNAVIDLNISCCTDFSSCLKTFDFLINYFHIWYINSMILFIYFEIIPDNHIAHVLN